MKVYRGRLEIENGLLKVGDFCDVDEEIEERNQMVQQLRAMFDFYGFHEPDVEALLDKHKGE